MRDKEKLRAWARANYAKKKDDPAFRERYRGYHNAAYRRDRIKIAAERKEQRLAERADPATWQKRALRICRDRAVAKGVAFSITAADLVVPTVCPVLGIPIQRTGKLTANSPSVDRLKPELGYVPGNVAVISMRANRMKYNATSAEIRLLLAWMEAKGL